MGEKTGSTLLEYSNGKDTRTISVIPNVQSVGVQVSYGVRCGSRGDVVKYISSLCTVSNENG